MLRLSDVTSAIILLFSVSTSVFASDKLLQKKERFDENYSDLIEQSFELPTWKQPFESLPILVGAGARWQYQNTEFIDPQSEPKDHENKLLQRYNIHLDWYISNSWRAFAQLNYSDAINSNLAPSPVDQNDLELQQLVVQYADGTKDLRLGKQEIVLNKKRLFGSRDGTNVKRSHTAVRYEQAFREYNISMMLGSPTKNNQGSWLDEVNHQEKYYQLGVSRDDWFVDFYFYKNEKPMAGVQTAYRNMLTGYYEHAVSDWYLSHQAFIQWGHTADKEIKAWRYIGDAEIELSQDTALELELDIASGGQSDSTINTFDPMYMKGDLLSLLASFTSSNLITFHPQLTYELSPSIELLFESSMYWRFDSSDSLYSPNRRKAMPSNWRGNYVGTSFAMEVEYQVTEHIELELSAGRLFLDQTLTELGLEHTSEVEITFSLSF